MTKTLLDGRQIKTGSIPTTALSGGVVSSSAQINTGSFSGSFRGTLIGTGSWATNAISSSLATTASFALNTGTSAFPFTGSAIVSGSLIVTGTLNTSNDVQIRNAGAANIYLNNGAVGNDSQIVYSSGEMRIGTLGIGTLLSFLTNGTVRYYIDGTGNFLPNANNTYDIGATGTRIRTIWTNVISSSQPIASASYALTAATVTSASFATTAATASSFVGYINFPGGLDVTGSSTISGSLTVIRSSITALSGSITSSGPQNGLYLTNGVSAGILKVEDGSVILNAENAFLRLRVNGGGFYYDGWGLSPENDNLRSLGSSGLTWASGYINNIFSSGSIIHTGSLVITGSGITTTAGSVTSIFQSDAVNGVTSVGSTSAHDLMLFSNSTYRAFVGIDGIHPGQHNAYGLGRTIQRWNNAYINNIFSSGSITNSGSISVFNATSGNTTVLNGNTIELGNASFGYTYINFGGVGSLLQYGPNGVNYNNATGYGIVNQATWTFDSYASGRRIHFGSTPFFNGETIATGSGTAGLDGLLVNPTFGTAAKLRWDSSNTINGLAVEPIFNINLGSTGRLTALRIMPSSSLALTSSMSLINAGVNGTSSFVVSASGDVTIQRQLTVFGGITGSSGVTITGPANIIGALQATTKSFKIDHQRLSGKSLIYGVLEGPEHGVYARGRLTNNNIIQLPEEWEWLVDPDSITVQLTPIGTQQILYVQNIENNTVSINSNASIDCFYFIQATRKDVAPLSTIE